MRLSCGRVVVTLGVAGLLAACSSPVRLATPAEIRQATAPTPSPQANTAPGAPAPSPTAGTGTAPAPTPSTAPAGSGALAGLQNELRALIDQVMPSVVEIDTSGGLGSGVVLDGQGDIVTNAHVVGSSRSFTVRASDGSTRPASLVGSYPNNDLAVIKASGGSALKPATLGDSTQLHVGDIVLTFGSPLGLTGSVSEGLVSGLGRSQSEGGGVTLTNLIQTTAAISPGNSGGALVNISGQVVGIPTLGATDSPRNGGTASNIGFAIPSSQVANVTKQLISNGSVTNTGIAYLGITTSNTGTGGAQIASVVAGGPSEKAGVQSGWVITSLGGHPVSDSSSISQILSGFKPGDKIDLVATLPDGSTKTVQVTLGERPANP
jgi:putative serine protease PepD